MKNLIVNQRYGIKAPDWQSDIDRWSEWERQRFLSMESELTQGDVLFDVGSEDGVISGIYAQFVGPENMCLLEPAIENWPNIREIWSLNNFPDPLACFFGFASAHTHLAHHIDDGWPELQSEPLVDRKIYKYLFEDNPEIDSITLDDWAAYIGRIPNAITIDVEGAEYQVLQGASKILHEYQPKVWVSVHPDLMLKNFNEDDDEVHRFMRQHGYKGELLGVDHEQHFLYSPL